MRNIINSILLIIVIILGWTVIKPFKEEVPNYNLNTKSVNLSSSDSKFTKLDFNHKFYKKEDLEIIAENNLFHPDRIDPKLEEEDTSEEDDSESEIITIDDMILKGVIIVENNKYAFVLPKDEDKPIKVTEGEELGDYIVKEIYPDKIYLKTPDNLLAKLALKNDWGTKRKSKRRRRAYSRTYKGRRNYYGYTSSSLGRAGEKRKKFASSRRYRKYRSRNYYEEESYSYQKSYRSSRKRRRRNKATEDFMKKFPFFMSGMKQRSGGVRKSISGF